jgi:DNA topoisomerase IB
VSSADINAYVKEVVGGVVSAKDFRTWHGTVLAAVALAERAVRAGSRTARTTAVRQAMVDVAEYLGNTPAVVRKSYVDPRLVDLFDSGKTIAPALRRVGDAADRDATRDQIERAVLRLLSS